MDEDHLQQEKGGKNRAGKVQEKGVKGEMGKITETEI